MAMVQLAFQKMGEYDIRVIWRLMNLFFLRCCLLGCCLWLLSAADSSVVGSKVNSTTFAIVAADRDFVKEDLGAV